MRRTYFSTLLLIMILQFSTISAFGLPEIYIETTDGTDLNLQSFEGEVFMFMAISSECSSCKIQNGYLKEIYSSTTELTILSISIDTELDTIPRLVEYKESESIPWSVGLDYTEQLRITYQINSYPQLFLIDKEGNIAQKWLGVTTAETMSRVLENYIDIELKQDENPVLTALQKNYLFILWGSIFLFAYPIYLFTRLVYRKFIV